MESSFPTIEFEMSLAVPSTSSPSLEQSFNFVTMLPTTAASIFSIDTKPPGIESSSYPKYVPFIGQLTSERTLNELNMPSHLWIHHVEPELFSEKMNDRLLLLSLT